MSTDASKVETIVAYAALILADEGLDITPEKLQTLISAANIEGVEPIWTTLFAKALQGKEVKDILTQVTTSTPEVGKQQPAVDGNDHNEPDEGEDKDGEGVVDEDSDDDGMYLLFD